MAAADSDDDEMRVPLWGPVVFLTVMVAWSFYLLPSVIHQLAPYAAAGTWGPAIGTLLGRGFFMATVVWAIFFALALRGRGRPGTGTTYFVIFLLIPVLIGVGGLYWAKTQSEAAAAANAPLRASLDAADAAIADGLSTEGDSVELPPTASGEAGAVGAKARETVLALSAAFAEGRRQVKQLNFPGFLKPRSLAARGGIAGARANLVKIGEIRKSYTAKVEVILDDYRAWLSARKIDGAVKREALMALATTTNSYHGLRTRIDTGEGHIFDECDALLRDLKRAAPWHAEGDVMMFSSTADLTRYRQHRENIEAYQSAIDPIVAKH